jgi:hypothetical protein
MIYKVQWQDRNIFFIISHHVVPVERLDVRAHLLDPRLHRRGARRARAVPADVRAAVGLVHDCGIKKKKKRQKNRKTEEKKEESWRESLVYVSETSAASVKKLQYVRASHAAQGIFFLSPP